MSITCFFPIGLIPSYRFARNLIVPSSIWAFRNCHWTCSKAQYTVVIDADLQDPPELIYELFKKAKEGYDVVYAQRRTRVGDTFLKKLITFVGYKVINKASNLNIPRNTGDFRIMSRRAVKEVVSMDDRDCFLRGLVSYVGFNQTSINFDRPTRASGKSKYNEFTGSLSFGIKGFVSFSNSLLYASTYFGIFVSFIAFLIGIIYAYFKIKGIVNFPIGNPTIVILILFMGGVQLFSIGILGIYIGQIFEQVKNRPPFVVDKYFGKF